MTITDSTEGIIYGIVMARAKEEKWDDPTTQAVLRHFIFGFRDYLATIVDSDAPAA